MQFSAYTLLLLAVSVYGLLFVFFTFAASKLTFRLRSRNLHKAHFWGELESKWEPLLDDISQGKRVSDVIRPLVRAGEELYFVDLIMRRALLAPVQQVSIYRDLAAPYLQTLAQRVATGDREQRARAIHTLAVLGEQQYLPVFMQALEDKSPLVALLSARALAAWGEPAVAEHLLPALQRFEAWNPNVLASLLVSLGKSVAPALRTSLRDNSHSAWVRTIALKALTELRDPLATPLAVDILRQEKDINLQIAAIQLLAQMGGSEHISLIRQRYNSPSFPVRLHAIRALGILGNNADHSTFRQALDDPSPWVAMEAAQSLKITGHHRVLHELDLAEHPRSELAGQMLGSFNSLEFVEQSVKDDAFAPHVGQLFLELKKHDSHEVRALVNRLFFDPSTSAIVRYAMATELEKFRDYQFFYQTLSCLMMRHFTDQRSLIRALKSFANPESVPILMQFYAQAGWDERLEIIEALGVLDSMESFEFLSKVYNEMHDNHNLSVSQRNQMQDRLAMALAQRMMV
jgi:HEAT repeat protein